MMVQTQIKHSQLQSGIKFAWVYSLCHGLMRPHGSMKTEDQKLLLQI